MPQLPVLPYSGALFITYLLSKVPMHSMMFRVIFLSKSETPPVSVPKDWDESLLAMKH